MLKDIKLEIEKAKNIVIAGHISPDGDCIGASIALKYMIEELDSTKNVKVLIDDNLPKYVEELEYLPTIYREIEDDVDLFISVDVANRDRVASKDYIINKAKKTINIDHHISNTKYFDINYVEEISSASELVYKFIDIFGININKKIATYIYLGIINDTGNFRHKNVNSSTFLVASELLKTGIDNNKIYFSLFSKSLKKAEVFSKSIIDGVYDEKTKFMYYYLSNDEINKNNYDSDDIEGVSEYMLTIKGVEVSLFIKQTNDGRIKGSFRSKNIDVNKIASKLGGGGHKLAAGFITELDNVEIIKITRGEL